MKLILVTCNRVRQEFLGIRQTNAKEKQPNKLRSCCDELSHIHWPMVPLHTAYPQPEIKFKKNLNNHTTNY